MAPTAPASSLRPSTPRTTSPTFPAAIEPKRGTIGLPPPVVLWPASLLPVQRLARERVEEIVLLIHLLAALRKSLLAGQILCDSVLIKLGQRLLEVKLRRRNRQRHRHVVLQAGAVAATPGAASGASSARSRRAASSARSRRAASSARSRRAASSARPSAAPTDSRRLRLFDGVGTPCCVGIAQGLCLCRIARAHGDGRGGRRRRQGIRSRLLRCCRLRGRRPPRIVQVGLRRGSGLRRSPGGRRHGRGRCLGRGRCGDRGINMLRRWLQNRQLGNLRALEHHHVVQLPSRHHLREPHHGCTTLGSITLDCDVKGWTRTFRKHRDMRGIETCGASRHAGHRDMRGLVDASTAIDFRKAKREAFVIRHGGRPVPPWSVMELFSISM